MQSSELESGLPDEAEQEEHSRLVFSVGGSAFTKPITYPILY